MIRCIKNMVHLIRSITKRIQKTVKWFRRLRSIKKNTLRILNLAADGYGLFTMVEPQLMKKK